MASKIRIAILGFGNIGKYAVDAVKASPDMELTGIVEPAGLLKGKALAAAQNHNLVTNIGELAKVDVALLCIPTRLVPDVAAEVLAQGINTIDSYDIHGQVADLRIKLDRVARSNGAVAVNSAGWDPGSDSMVRCMFEFMLPRGITYTNFGPGMSMGHTVAAKAIPGVENALSMTIPIGTGVHRRMVYVQLKPGSDFNAVVTAIKSDPYFINDETIVSQVADVEMLLDVGHGVQMERKGVSGLTHNQLLSYSMKINNPALTAQIMVAAARASLKQKPGSYTMIQIPIIDYMYGDEDEIIRHLV
ncbi:MAG: diaminopimelate dehydrogenase [Syntrophomonadaceae bacterium]|jgi:diaminopimelate dehydrogenase|nr:diaminopimelate dehydrogenase [Syntrophomonadaceae bacterium]